MTESEQQQGPSKNELKKMAKKAEKAAKKQQQKGEGGDPAAVAAAAVVPPNEQPLAPAAATTTETATATAGTPTLAAGGGVVLVLVNPSLQDRHTIQVVWAAQRFGVTVQVASPSQVRQAQALLGYNSNDATLWTFQEDGDLMTFVGGDGNAMAQAIAGLATTSSSSSSSLSLAQQMLQDEWCEWERTVLRRAVMMTTTTESSSSSSSPALEAALTHLEHAVSNTLHLIGNSCVSLADMSVLSTLHYLTTIHNKDLSAWQPFPAIQRYRQAHEAALNSALVAVQALLDDSATTTTARTTTTTVSMDIGTLVQQEPRLTKVVELLFVQAVGDLFGNEACRLLLGQSSKKAIVTPCANPKHGDFQCTAAMPIFAALQAAGTLPPTMQSPQAVAQAMVSYFGTSHAVLTDLSMNGPGFVVCRLQASFLQHHVNAWLFPPQQQQQYQDDDDKQPPPLQVPSVKHVPRQTCVVDFSSPNIAKEMHVGHLRSTIIGEAVCRILESVGHTVHRINHVGDWGTQFGMLIQYLKEEYPTTVVGNTTTTTSAAGGGQEQNLPNITDLTEFYKAAKERFDSDADFKKLAQTNVVALQSGDTECVQIWHMLCDVSRREFHKVYQRLDVTTTECGESFYNALIPPVIQEFEAAGKIKIEEGGAKCVFLDQFKIPLMLQKSDGGYGYDSTDMAALKYRLQELKADRIIVITDFSQSDHFKMIYAAGRDIGWAKKEDSDDTSRPLPRLEHIGFGTVMGEDGKRFKTRSGETVRLVDLLDEAVHRMETTLLERIAQGKANITKDQVHAVAEAIGYGAVKYYDLRRNPTSNYKFSYDQMLSTSGETAVYLLYALVRLESIIDKAERDYSVNVDELLKTKTDMVVIGHASERNLALHLQKFADTMEQTLEDLYPCHICEYVYKLSIAASDFVTQCKVLGSPEMNSRLLLCRATTIAMKQCFDLLGIRHVKRI